MFPSLSKIMTCSFATGSAFLSALSKNPRVLQLMMDHKNH